MTQQEFFNRYSYNVRTDKIGGGSFGTVYKAYDNVLDRTVAIKVSEVKILGGKEFSLLDEFDAIKDLPLHPNIANYEALYNFDQANGIFDYAVLQYYPDGNLKDLIKKSDLSQEEKEVAALQVLAGLEFLHNHRVVHRDMKPSNILIQARNQGDKVVYVPKITDFGLSKKADPSAKSRFTNSFGGGTLEYSSPEQLRGQNLRFNTDLWAWAVIVYELFTGMPMFKTDGSGTDSAQGEKMIFDQILNSELIDKLSIFPENWQRALTACLDRNPETRVKTAEDIRAILRDEKPLAAAASVAASGENPAPAPSKVEVPEIEAATRIDSVREPEVQAAPQTEQAAPKQAAPSTNENVKSKKPLYVSLGVGALALVGVVLFFVLKSNPATTDALIVQQENELFGYKGSDSTWVIQPKYLSAEPFANGRAKVRLNDSIFYIDEKGNMLEFIALATIDPVDIPTADTTAIVHVDTPKSEEAWQIEFENKYHQLLDSEHKRSDEKNLKEYQDLLKTLPSSATAERNKVNSRIKYFKSRLDVQNPTPTPVANNAVSLNGLVDIYNEVYDYVGEVQNGMPHGKGTAKFRSGLKYTGDFKNGYRDGQGTVTFTDGAKYVGGFKSDKKQGQGTYTWADGGKYTGNWTDNKMHGKGTYFFPSGAKYVGDWNNDYMHGSGIYYYKDGARYDGQWKNDKKHGWGKYYNANGVLEYEGRYENDVRLF